MRRISAGGYTVIEDDSGKLERRTGDPHSTLCGMPVPGGWCHKPGEWRTLFRHVPDRDDAYWGYECDGCHRLPYTQERLESHRLH